jgi:hypothetical protein
MARSRNRNRSHSRKKTQKRTRRRTRHKRRSRAKKGGKRSLNSWQRLVKDTYRAGKRHNNNYTFGAALKEASKLHKKK